jgi:hypothetical protein
MENCNSPYERNMGRYKDKWGESMVISKKYLIR